MEILVFPNEVIGQKFIWNTRYPEEFLQIQVDCVVTGSIGLQQQYYENVTCYYLSKSFSVGHGSLSDDSHSSVTMYRTLDISSSGNRWEGDIKGDSSYGYGVLYKDKGEKVYEGFMFNGIIQGYGCRFYPAYVKLNTWERFIMEGDKDMVGCMIGKEIMCMKEYG